MDPVGVICLQKSNNPLFQTTKQRKGVSKVSKACVCVYTVSFKDLNHATLKRHILCTYQQKQASNQPTNKQTNV